ncbi:VOC family protein [Nonomuraea zeae]|uniref:VOC family protein n=1 Tax=Nonomuraea zeae TaxID=1642303 RepID=A0A5S4GV30_9ACTN|nr:VOC family protein [Nonomuraea zeae]TMR36371.1 VOC family protein [Nonomuraea zeae]
MIPLFRKLHHVCVVVADLDKAVAYYESVGIGPWFDYPKGGAYVEYDVPNAQASAAMRYKCADLDNFQLQLCQPPELDSPQRRFLDESGEGVYHLGFESDDLGTAEEQAGALGLDVIARGRRADGSGFCYFDTRAGAGVTLEVRKTQH